MKKSRFQISSWACCFRTFNTLSPCWIGTLVATSSMSLMKKLMLFTRNLLPILQESTGSTNTVKVRIFILWNSSSNQGDFSFFLMKMVRASKLFSVIWIYVSINVIVGSIPTRKNIRSEGIRWLLLEEVSHSVLVVSRHFSLGMVILLMHCDNKIPYVRLWGGMARISSFLGWTDYLFFF